jgi:hypothetical protein
MSEMPRDGGESEAVRRPFLSDTDSIVGPARRRAGRRSCLLGHETDIDAYFNEIESHFAFRRGTPFVFSGKDWALLKSWQESGIPLAIVLEAIDTAFDARERSGRKGPISSLSYCRHSVVELWEERKQQLVGGQGSVPELDPTAHVKALAATLAERAESSDGPVSRAFVRSAGELAELAEKTRATPAIEERLVDIENRMIESLLAAIPDESRLAMLSSIDAELARYDIASEETRERTREANLRRLLRKELRIPRLSLFG